MIIKRAWRDGGAILLTIDDGGSEYPYALYENDPYGNAPALREKLAGMVAAGFTIEPGPPPSPETKPASEGAT